MEWIQDNWVSIGLALSAFIHFAQTVARMTPTKKDDEIVSTIGKLLNTLFLKSKTK